MIPKAYITNWRQHVPWQSNEQVEQDLVISRALVALFTTINLSKRLAFRGGTAIHKLFTLPQPRYSEDIDLVQVEPEPIKESILEIQSALSFIGESNVKMKRNGFQVLFRFESEFPPIVRLRLKVETNTKEHGSVLGFVQQPFQVNSPWFSGSCSIQTYSLEELLGTKLRALYQRKKGRDLFDVYYVLNQYSELDVEKMIYCYTRYMQQSVSQPPSAREFLMNLDLKMNDDEFLGDTIGLLRPNMKYTIWDAYHFLKKNLFAYF